MQKGLSNCSDHSAWRTTQNELKALSSAKKKEKKIPVLNFKQKWKIWGG